MPMQPPIVDLGDGGRRFYAEFTEGFDTRDLIDVKALLDELR